MPTKAEINAILRKTEDYLNQGLLKFWIDNGYDPKHGGAMTHFNMKGQPTGDM